MEVYECIRSRVSVREFKPDPVPGRVIAAMLRAARWAPSARNRQPWNFIVIQGPRDPGADRANCIVGRVHRRCSLGIAVVMDRQGRVELDAGRAQQQMELVGWSHGVGGCIAGIRGEENDRVKELLAIPEDKELVTVMACGYPTDAARSGGKKAQTVGGDHPRRALRAELQAG